MGVTVREYRPAPALRGTVAAFYACARDGRPGGPPAATLDVLPDGSMDLIYRLDAADPGASTLLVSGADLRARPVEVGPGVAFVGARFEPEAARALLDLDPAPLVGVGALPARALSPRLAAIDQRLLAATGAIPDLLRALEREVAALARDATRPAPPPRVREAVALLRAPGGEARVAAVARAVGVTERTLRRDLVAWTGLPPKVLARIFRFRAVLDRLRARRGAAPLAALAAEAGYADQAHMAREFKALAAAPPGRFG